MIDHRLVGRLSGGLGWETATGRVFTAEKATLIKLENTTGRTLWVTATLSGNPVEIQSKAGDTFVALNAGDSLNNKVNLPWKRAALN